MTGTAFGVDRRDANRKAALAEKRRWRIRAAAAPNASTPPAGSYWVRTKAYYLTLSVHQKALSNRWVTRMPGVLTESGEMTPTGTIVCGSAMTTSAASAITGLKLCAVSEYSRLP